MTDEPMTVDQVYTSAINASNLRVEMDAERRSSADVLIAAAWNPSRLGSALLRLHSEFDGAQHPRRMTQSALDVIALSFDKGIVPLCLSEKGLIAHQQRRMIEARKAADDWYSHEVQLLLSRLKTLPEVRHQLTMQADRWGTFNPGDVAAAVLLWWLDSVCSACNGIKFELIRDTPVKSTKMCKVCRGSGEAHLPYLGEGRRLANHIDACIGEARHSIKNRLRRT